MRGKITLHLTSVLAPPRMGTLFVIHYKQIRIITRQMYRARFQRIRPIDFYNKTLVFLCSVLRKYKMRLQNCMILFVVHFEFLFRFIRDEKQNRENRKMINIIVVTSENISIQHTLVRGL